MLTACERTVATIKRPAGICICFPPGYARHGCCRRRATRSGHVCEDAKHTCIPPPESQLIQPCGTLQSCGRRYGDRERAWRVEEYRTGSKERDTADMSDIQQPTKSTKVDDFHFVVKGRKEAEAYTRRPASKHEGEMRTIRRALSLLSNCKTFLDAPCGAARATIFLAQEGYEVTGIDLGEGAVAVSREQAAAAGVKARFQQADVQHLPFVDREFDAVLCFRLYHHFPHDPLRVRVINELCRVSRRYVLMSYVSPYAYTSIRRSIQQGLGIKKTNQHATSLRSVCDKFDRNHFRLIADIPRQRFVHTLHLAVFERT